MQGRSQTGRSAAAVCAVAGPLAVAAALLILAFGRGGAPAGAVTIPWPALALCFGVAQSNVLHLQIKREARSVSITDAPFVFALFVLSGPGFIAARVLGGVAAQVIARRQYRDPLKLAFNAVAALGEAAVGLAVFRLVAHDATVTEPRLWLAGALAAIAANVVSALAVAVLISRLERGPGHVRNTLLVVATSVAHAAPTASVGLVAAVAVDVNVWAVLPLAVACATLFVGYRAYARLAERHESLERLYRFSQVIAGITDTEQVLRSMLEHVCEMLHADGAALTFLDDNGQPRSLATWRRDRGLERMPCPAPTPASKWLIERVLREGQPMLLARESRDPDTRRWLSVRGFTDALVVPLRRDDSVVAALTVNDRMGAARGFDSGDLRLLVTVANHASIALRNGELVERLRYDSLHDALTGIPNRVHLQNEVDRMIAELAEGGEPFAVAMIDLDSFKEVNDTLGHHQGDTLLKEVAHRLSTAVVGRGIVTRFGGDEFAVLLPNCPTDEVVARHCRTVLDFLAAPVELDGMPIDIGASIGVARAPAHAGSRDELIKRADVAMYVAKQVGREVVVFDESQDTSSPARLAMLAALRQAINDGDLEVYVQPQLRLDTATVVSAEALLRWTHAEYGSVAPDVFVPLAERSGLIRPLTDIVLSKAIEACARWQSTMPGVGIAVNLSARSLHDEALDSQVERLLRRHRLSPRLLTLEITESSVMADPGRTLGLLHRLRMRGVRLSIDDFGTGYSSLSYLRRLPVQEVKVDRSFVQRMDAEAEDAAIVRSIIELARVLDMQVVAEGVENEHTWRLLDEMNCAMLQGYHLARPMPVAEFPVWYLAKAADLGRRPRLVAIGDG